MVVAALGRRPDNRKVLRHDIPHRPSETLLGDPLPCRGERNSTATSRSQLPTVRVEQRRPARHPLRAGLIDDVLIVASTVVGVAWIAVCAAALTRLTTGG